MKRTQLYLDDQLWNALHVLAERNGTTVSELVRAAVREAYFGNRTERREAMQGLVGLRRQRREFDDPEGYVRGLRRGTRIADSQ